MLMAGGTLEMLDDQINKLDREIARRSREPTSHAG
jgi:hypothetical protein